MCKYSNSSQVNNPISTHINQKGELYGPKAPSASALPMEQLTPELLTIHPY